MNLFYSFIIFFGIISINCEKLPADIELCHSEDHACIIKVSNGLLKNYPNGRPDLDVPPIDPFFVKTADLNFPGGKAMDLKMKFNDINVIGLSNLAFDRAVGFTKHPTTSKFELYGHIPRLEFNGNYKANGKILVMPIHGDGKFKIILKDVRASLKFKPQAYKKSDDLTYLKVDKIKFHLDPKSVEMNFENLFKGNKGLSESINAVINENWHDLWVEFAAPTYEIAEQIIQDIATRIFDRFSYDEIYAD